MTLRRDPVATEERPLPFQHLPFPPHPVVASEGRGQVGALYQAQSRARVLTAHVPLLPFAGCLALGNLPDLSFPKRKRGLQHPFFGLSWEMSEVTHGKQCS